MVLFKVSRDELKNLIRQAKSVFYSYKSKAMDFQCVSTEVGVTSEYPCDLPQGSGSGRDHSQRKEWSGGGEPKREHLVRATTKMTTFLSEEVVLEAFKR